MSTIPWTEIALGSARQIGLAEGLEIGLISGKQLFKKDIDAARQEGWMARNFEQRQQGFTVFNPASGNLPQSVDLKTAIDMLKTHTGNKQSVQNTLGLNTEEDIKKAQRNPQGWFIKMAGLNSVNQVPDARPVRNYEYKLDGSKTITGRAIEFKNAEGTASLLFTRGKLVENTTEVTPIRGPRLRPTPRTPMSPEVSNPYVESPSYPTPALLPDGALDFGARREYNNDATIPSAYLSSKVLEFKERVGTIRLFEPLPDEDTQNNLSQMFQDAGISPTESEDTARTLEAVSSNRRPIRINAGKRTTEKFADSKHST